MKTACVIAEYHPFHNGHARMAALLHAMGYTAVIAVMSGNFVQRGTPALLPKEVRAAAALRGGMDLVLELPCQAAADTAQRFAAAGTAAAAACGADVLAFGAEDADLALLQTVCNALCSPRFAPLLKNGLAEGQPFHAARAAAAEVLCPGAAAVMAKPNNILAIEYLLALRRLRMSLPKGHKLPLPLPLPRYGAAHDAGPSGDIASAAWLRARPINAWTPYVPAAALPLYRQAQQEGRILEETRWQCAALALLRSRTPAQLAALPDAGEGLDALLYAAVRSSTTLEEVYNTVKSKRYAHARIRRLTLAAVLGWTAPADGSLSAGSAAPTDKDGTSADSTAPAGSGTPAGSAASMSIDSGLPADSAIPADNDTSAGSSVSAGGGLPAGSSVPTDNDTPAGNRTPANSAVPANNGTPAGSSIPAGGGLPAACSVPACNDMPAGSHTPAGNGMSAVSPAPADSAALPTDADTAEAVRTVLECGGQLPYLRVLGGTAAGLQALGRLSVTCPLPISSSLAALQRRGGACRAAAMREAAAGDVYSLCLRRPGPCGQEYRLPFLKV